MCLQWGDVPSALWLSGFRAIIQNTVVYIACEFSIFQGQIPISLKSLANTQLPSGSLDLDTEKKKTKPTTPNWSKQPQNPTAKAPHLAKLLKRTNLLFSAKSVTRGRLYPSTSSLTNTRIQQGFIHIDFLWASLLLQQSDRSQRGARREGVQLPPHWQWCKATPSASEPLKSEYIKFY